MDDAVVVEVGDGGESCANEVCGVGFVVASFSAYSIEEFTAEGEVCDEIDWGCASAWRSCEVQGDISTVVHGLEVVHQRQDVLMSH